MKEQKVVKLKKMFMFQNPVFSVPRCHERPFKFSSFKFSKKTLLSLDWRKAFDKKMLYIECIHIHCNVRIEDYFFKFFIH